MKQRYSHIAISLHWIMAIVILTTWTIAQIAGGMPVSPERILAISWHKWLGLTVLWLVFVRLFWRATHPAPELAVRLPAWQERIMQLTHLAFYLLMIAIPIIGWLMSSAKGYTVNYFGLYELPDLVLKDKATGILLKQTHEILANILISLVALHVLAALKHHFWDKDGLLKRMSFFK